MGVFDQGGGGGPAPSLAQNTNYALDKPYEVTGDPTIEKMAQIDEMLRLLFEAATNSRRTITETMASVVQGTIIQNVINQNYFISSTAAVKIVSRVLTASELGVLNTVPILLVPAPAFPNIIWPIFWAIEQDVSSAYGATGGSYLLEYGSAAWSGFSILSTISASLNGVATVMNAGNASGGTFSLYGVRDPRNKSLRIRCSTDPAPGVNSNGKARVFVVYQVFESVSSIGEGP